MAANFKALGLRHIAKRRAPASGLAVAPGQLTRWAVATLPWLLCLALLTLAVLTPACSRGEAPSAKTFIGKWKSSKLTTPIYLYENGEWEIKKDDGAVLQYGAWEYKDGKVIWSFKVGAEVAHDVNPVVFATPTQFKLREVDQTVTSFDKLD